jgi:uncharacterized membrane protein
MGPTVAAILVVISALIGGIAFANFILPHQFTVGERQALRPQSGSAAPAALTHARDLHDTRAQMEQAYSARRQRSESVAVRVRSARERAEDSLATGRLDDLRLDDPREALRRRLPDAPSFQDDWRR